MMGTQTKSIVPASCLEAERVSFGSLPFPTTRVVPSLPSAADKDRAATPGTRLHAWAQAAPFSSAVSRSPEFFLTHSSDLVRCENGAIGWKTILFCNHRTVFRSGTVQK